MTNTLPTTGIRYGVINLNNSIDPDIAQGLFYSFGRDLSYEQACADIRREVVGDADDIEDQAQIKACELGLTGREYEDFIEHEIEETYHARGYDDRDEFIEGEVEARTQDLQIEEPVIEGEYEGVKYRIDWLGGAPILFVLQGPEGYCNSLCSPCVPNAGDLDSGFEQWDDLEEDDWDGKGYECYVVPRDWLRKDFESEGGDHD